MRVQQPAWRQGSAWLERGGGRALLIGPVGSGKTFCLETWAHLGLGAYHHAEDLVSLGSAELSDRLLVDEVEALDSEQTRSLVERLAGRSFILGIRGVLTAASPGLRMGPHEEAVYPTELLARATSQRLPLPFLESIDGVLSLPYLEEEDLRELALFFAAPARALPEAVLAGAVKVARASSRGAHELRALLGRLGAEDRRQQVRGGGQLRGLAKGRGQP